MKKHLDEDEVIPLLSHWGILRAGNSLDIRAITGGLSGATIWRISRAGQQFCLRRWPPNHPAPDQLRTIHRAIEHIWQAGLHIVPMPQKTLRGDSYIAHEGHLWELSLWLAGEPLSSLSSNSQQCRAAVEALAKFHLAANNFDSGENRSQFGPAPGLLQRQNILANQLQGNLAELSQAVQLEPPSLIRETMAQMLRMIERVLPEAFAAVEKCARVPLPLQWCLRDIHPGNILVTGGNVTGIIDFGATSFDSIAGDLARLVGGFDCEPIKRQELLKDYGKIRPFTVEEQRAVGAYLVGGLISSAANWVRWLVIERSVLPGNTTQARLAELVRQLVQLGSWETEDVERFWGSKA